MATERQTELSMLIDQLNEMRGHLATLFDILNRTDGWNQRHGSDWTFADVPYHLAYCNRDMVARGIEMGANLPESERELVTSIEELSAWNARYFAKRPADQTVAQSLVEWEASCDRIRALAERMEPADLDKPFWMPLFMGWATVRDGLTFCRDHDWSEFTQLRVHMGRDEPTPSPAVTRAYFNSMMHFMPMFLNPEAAANTRLTTVMKFTDPGVGAWTIRVADGRATVSEGATPDADLVITQSAETFEKNRQHIGDPATAIQSGALQVSNFEKLATFGQLFPM